MGLVTLAIGSSPLGNLEQGLIAERWGAPVAIGSSALLCAVIVTLVAWWYPRVAAPTLHHPAGAGQVTSGLLAGYDEAGTMVAPGTGLRVP